MQLFDLLKRSKIWMTMQQPFFMDLRVLYGRLVYCQVYLLTEQPLDPGYASGSDGRSQMPLYAVCRSGHLLSKQWDVTTLKFKCARLGTLFSLLTDMAAVGDMLPLQGMHFVHYVPMVPANSLASIASQCGQLNMHDSVWWMRSQLIHFTTWRMVSHHFMLLVGMNTLRLWDFSLRKRGVTLCTEWGGATQTPYLLMQGLVDI